MKKDSRDLFNIITREMEKKYSLHSMILYGSRARGEETEASDLDIALFSDEIEETKRDARVVEGIFLDAFIYPTKTLSQADESLLKMRSGIILKDDRSLCRPFLQDLDRLFSEGPKPLSQDEMQARKTWALKMIERAKINDVEGNYRRVWLLTALIEDFFVMRGEWFLGPKESFKSLKANHPELFSIYTKALNPNAPLNDIEQLAQRIASENNI